MERSIQPTGNATPADIDWNGRPISIRMGGRHHAGITGRLRRNAQVSVTLTVIWQALRAVETRSSRDGASAIAVTALRIRLNITCWIWIGSINTTLSEPCSKSTTTPVYRVSIKASWFFTRY
jgi:hypothetical protein